MKNLIKSFNVIDNIEYFIFKIKGLWKLLAEAIKGADEDYTSVSMKRAIFLLSVPMILEMLMESVFAVVDIFFVSKLGAEAVAVVGITETLTTIVYAIGIGLSVAATAVISRRIGEKNNSAANNAAFQAILTVLLPGLSIGIIGIAYSEEILVLMGISKNIAIEYNSYTAIILGSNIIIMLLFIINGIFRSAGDASIAMKALWMANILNIMLDPILIFGWGPIPAMGIKGAAIATSIGRGLAVLFQFYVLFSGKSRIKLVIKDIHLDLKVIFSILKLSTGTIGQYLIATASWIALMRILAEFGSSVLAGYTIALRIIVFALLPTLGLGNAASTLTGQNLGAKRPDRAERAVWATGKLSMIFLGLIGLVFIILPEFWIKIFIDDPDVIIAGARSLQIISIGFAFYGLGVVLVHSINGAGDTFTPTIINLICFWLIEIPIAYFMAYLLGWKETGVFLAIVLAESLMTLSALWVFKRGKWKTREV